MSPQLITAIKERIVNGNSRDSIRDEVLAMGHSEELFSAAYLLAEHDIAKGDTPTAVSVKTYTSIHTLIKNAADFASREWRMTLLIVVPLILFVLYTAIEQQFSQNLYVTAVVSGVSLITVVFYVAHLLAALYLVSREKPLNKESYREALGWVRKNILKLFWVYLLTTLAVIGGFIFFIVPGFVLLVTLYFSQYIYVAEDKRGMAALQRSRQLVKGRWFFVLKKITGLVLYFFIPVFVAAFMVGVVSAFYPLEKFSLLGEVLMQVVTGFFSVVGMHVMFHLYRELWLPEEENITASSLTYWLLALLGAVAVPAFIVAAIVTDSISELEESVPVITSDGNEVALEIQSLSTDAQLYKVERGSFEGVCEVLGTRLSSSEGVACNDAPDSWAIAAFDGGDTWCLDASQATAKRVPSELGEKTSCIAP